MAVAETFAEAARKASNGNWRKPRAKIYDYNQEFGGNYYQPMIQYVVERENYGPYHERRPVQMPERAEINSNKYTQMRHEDYRNTDLELEHFLTRAYKSQIKDINSSTAKAHRLIAHNSKDSTYKTGQQLLGYHVAADNDRYHYASELNIINQRDYMRREKEAQMEAMAELERQRRKQWVEEYLRYGPDGPPPEELNPEVIERVKDVRAKMYWIYRPRNARECKVTIACEGICMLVGQI
eukprot:TCALIF_03001-PA protein Name:"Protein of unknown function" AED:0.25 eAED:0.25 QI:5/0.4/0.16/0.5/1/0.83/6/0/238